MSFNAYPFEAFRLCYIIFPQRCRVQVKKAKRPTHSLKDYLCNLEITSSMC